MEQKVKAGLSCSHMSGLPGSRKSLKAIYYREMQINRKFNRLYAELTSFFIVFILTLHIHLDSECLGEAKKSIVYICDIGKNTLNFNEG